MMLWRLKACDWSIVGYQLTFISNWHKGNLFHPEINDFMLLVTHEAIWSCFPPSFLLFPSIRDPRWFRYLGIHTQKTDLFHPYPRSRYQLYGEFHPKVETPKTRHIPFRQYTCTENSNRHFPLNGKAPRAKDIWGWGGLLPPPPYHHHHHLPQGGLPGKTRSFYVLLQ